MHVVYYKGPGDLWDLDTMKPIQTVFRHTRRAAGHRAKATGVNERELVSETKETNDRNH
jgi:hypothetical protein